MSIATRIEAIEQHLTDDYSVLTLAGADLTNVDKNIINLKPTWKERLLYFMNNGTDVVWNNWDKVVGEGTELTLNNTEKAPMKLDLKGNTYQDSTSISGGDAYDSPTPDHPQTVHVVSGDNEVEVSNQLFDMNWLSANNIVVSNGVATGSANNFYQNFDRNNKQIPNTNYGNKQIAISISAYISSLVSEIATTNGLSLKIIYVDGTYDILRFLNNTTTKTTQTLVSNSNKEIDHLSFTYGSSPNNVWSVSEIMITYGDTPQTYEPYQGASYPISLGTMELCKIGDYQDRFFKTSGKNILDTNKNPDYLLKYQNDTTEYERNESTIIVKPLSNGNQYAYSFAQYFLNDLKPNTSYTISLYAKVLTSGQISIDITNARGTAGTSSDRLLRIDGTSNNQYLSGTFTTPSDTSNLSIVLYSLRGTYYSGAKVEYTNIMLNEGTSALDYEPYGSGEWYLKKILYKTNINIDGLQVYDIGTLKGSTMKVQNKIQSRTVCVLCSNAYEDLANKRENSFYENPANIMFIGSSTDTLQDLKNKFNGGTIYYPLATPTYTKIEGTLASQLEALNGAKSYTGQTNISQTNDDLPFNLSVTALKEV